MASRKFLDEVWRERVSAVLAVRAQMVGTRGMERWALWQKKRALGDLARNAHLARMFVRGVAYRRVEPVTDEVHNPLPVYAVAALVDVPMAAIEAWMAGRAPKSEPKPEAGELAVAFEVSP